MRHAKSAAQNRLVGSEQIVGKTDARLRHDAAAVPSARRESECWFGEPHTVQRISSIGGDDVAAVRIDRDRIRRVVSRRIEQSDLVVGVVLRRNPGKAHAIVERQARRNLPRVLHIELELVVAELTQRRAVD